MSHGCPGSPLVSAVIPAYQASREIPAALASVFAQTGADCEVIVVDDGSPDERELREAIAPFRERIRLITQRNRGAGAARNTAIAEARGQFLAFLDAGDRWRPMFLERQLAYLERHPDRAMVYCDAMLTGETPLAGTRVMEGAPPVGDVTLLTLIQQTCNVPMSTVVVRRDVVVAAGLFDQGLRRGQDYDLWLRLAGPVSGSATTPRCSPSAASRQVDCREMAWRNSNRRSTSWIDSATASGCRRPPRRR
jgi:glycosyltransferase involved in cell wall biosynthesis